MTFFEHLVELRKRLIHSMIAIGIGAFIGVYIAKYVIDFVTRPILRAFAINHLESKLIYTHPAGVFNLILSLGIYIGIVLASPVVLYQIWLFVAPALYKHERSAIAGFLFSTVFLFIAGIAFGYFVTLPYVLNFLMGFQSSSLPNITPMITVNEYFDLTLMILLGLGLVFELPVLMFFLSLFGIVTPQFLWKNVRYAIALIAVVAAIITPTPDATTMLIFMAPMLGLYFIGMGVSWLVVRSKNKKLAAEAAASAGNV
jgi:sec-independent protein translocase protein TatC